MKICKTCGQTKEENQFWSNPKTRDKLKTSCIDCCRQYNKAHYNQNRKERIKEVREYQQNKNLKSSNSTTN